MQAPIEIPNFEILEELGRGGMARVYLARQLQPKRKVAVKIVTPAAAQDDSFMEALKREGDMAAQCSHTNIVTVYACGVIDHHYYLAMELLTGGDLTARIKSGTNAEDALSILEQMASALEHAHSINLLHRDIKPENIMFHKGGKAVLVDFGIAKEQDTESNFTKAGAVVGTPHYMSPERATGKPIDARSDIYALGVVFYEMLTGHKLYEGADTFAISYAHVYEAIPSLPPPYEKYQALLNKLVAKDPADRFQCAGELLQALASPTASEGPSTSATVAVTPSKIDSRSVAVKAEEPAAKRKLPLIPALGVTALLAAVVVATLVMRDIGGATPSGGDNLTTEERIRMQELLQSAATFTKLGNYEQAEGNLVKVLMEFDCRNQEARRGLQGINPSRADEIVAGCN